MFNLINRNMSGECVRSMTNRSGALPKEQKKMKCIISSHIIECFFCCLYSIVSYEI